LNRLVKILLILLITLVALFTRLRAVERLDIDYDEDDYLRAGQQYATAIAVGRWEDFTQLNYRPEHPPLAKIVYGFALASLPPAPEIPARPTTAQPAPRLPQPHLTVARSVAAAFGTLQVALLSFLNPLAGLILAIHTREIKYTTEVMLEALPSLLSLIVIMAYQKAGNKWNAWLMLSAIALGLMAASKYLYGVVGLAIVIWHVRLEWRNRDWRAFWPLVAWGLLALIIFYLTDPYLWPDPVNRLRESVFYHTGYAQSTGVVSAGLPVWQPFVWLFGAAQERNAVFVVAFDFFIALFALRGLQRLRQRHPLYALWFALAFGFLLVWPTKWPQYILILTVPFTLAAAEGMRATFDSIYAQWSTYDWRKVSAQWNWKELKTALPWLAPGMVVLVALALYPLVYQGAMALTDFNSLAIRDGLNGGVWREVGLGLTGQVAGDTPAIDDLFSQRPTTVHYRGFGLLWSIFSWAIPEFLVFNILWMILAVSLQTGLGLGVALLLNRPGVRGKVFWRTLYVLPWAIPEFVGALIWFNIFEPSKGWLSLALGREIPWGDNPHLALGVLLVAATWLGWPLLMLAATAGLQQIPPEVYEAAELDGATAWEQFRAVTWPMLWPLLAPALIIRAIFTFNQFYLFYMLRPPWPLLTLTNLSFITFNTNERGGGLFALSATLNLFIVVVLAIVVSVSDRWGQTSEGVTYA